MTTTTVHVAWYGEMNWTCNHRIYTMPPTTMVHQHLNYSNHVSREEEHPTQMMMMMRRREEEQVEQQRNGSCYHIHCRSVLSVFASYCCQPMHPLNYCCCHRSLNNCSSTHSLIYSHCCSPQHSGSTDAAAVQKSLNNYPLPLIAQHCSPPTSVAAVAVDSSTPGACATALGHPSESAS